MNKWSRLIFIRVTYTKLNRKIHSECEYERTYYIGFELAVSHPIRLFLPRLCCNFIAAHEVQAFRASL